MSLSSQNYACTDEADPGYNARRDAGWVTYFTKPYR
jgi:hypothetical protein